MNPVPFLHRFSFKIIAGLISMLFLVGLPFFFVFLSYHRNQLLETMENSTSGMSRVLTNQLEISVLEQRNHELPRVVERLTASGGAVRRIMVIDPNGKIVASSDPVLFGRTLSRYTDSGCRECHSSVTLKSTIGLTDADGTSYYRNVSVIQNRPACFGCHGSKSPVAGIFVMDFSQESLKAQFHSSLFRLILMAASMLVLTIGVLYVLLNHLVLRRLRRFEDAAERIGPDRFGRVVMPGKDEFAQLATSFNLMSQRLESAMKEVKEGKDYLESVINNIDDEIVVLDRNYDVVTANAAYARNSHIGRDPRFPADAEPLPHPYETCACTSTFKDGQVHKILQTLITQDGKERHIEVFSSPLRNELGEVSQVIEVRRDITERKLLEANLAHSERLISLGLLASGLSHEINNPLASISTFVEGLKRRMERSGGQPQEGLKGLEYSLGLIQREIDRARDITRRLLILSQKDSSGSSLVDLNESLRETVQLVRYEASKRHMDIDLDLVELPILKLSESQVRQVFLNLLLNSLQAGHEGGKIVCRTWRENGRAFACVEDDGTGIETAELVKVFEPFFSKKASGQGTGLGLFICKSIISSWGGSIEVQSRAGQGARFTLWIPIQT